MRRGHESEITMSPWLHGMWIREKNSQLDRFALILIMCKLTLSCEESDLCRVCKKLLFANCILLTVLGSCT